jgi:hypothetical protein
MKMNQWALAPRIALCSAVLATMIVGCSEKQATTRPETLSTQVPAPQSVAEPKEAKDILLRMAKYLAQAPRFSVNIQGNYDVVQESGQKIEFGETRTITVNRPNRLRVESEQSDGDKHVVLYDGKDITTFSPSQNVYAQVSKPGGIDEAVTYFLKNLHMRLPLAMLLLSRFPEELERRTQSLDYVERTKIHGTPAHHLAGRTETVDYQVWIAEGVQPLPLRAVLTYKNAEGQPQFRAQFTDWNLSPEIQDSQFAFVPPEEARKIAFLAQLPQIELKGVTPTKQTGRQK